MSGWAKSILYSFSIKSLVLIQVIFAVACLPVLARDQDRKAVPFTRTDNVREEIHGVEIVDPYRWPEDGQSTETHQWIKTQNRYTRSMIGSLPGRNLERSFHAN